MIIWKTIGKPLAFIVFHCLELSWNGFETEFNQFLMANDHWKTIGKQSFSLFFNFGTDLEQLLELIVSVLNDKWSLENYWFSLVFIVLQIRNLFGTVVELILITSSWHDHWKTIRLLFHWFSIVFESGTDLFWNWF